MIEESFKIALRALAANALRTSLTMLGILIGVGAVIALLAIGQGAQAAVEQSYAFLGTNVLYVRPGAQSSGGIFMAAGSAATLTYDDAVAIAAPGAAPAVAAVAPVRNGGGQIVYQGTNTNTRLLGTTPSWLDVRSFRVERGEFFDDQAVEATSSVAVLGANVAARLFPDEEPIGQTLRINAGGQSLNVTVIGVLESKGGTGFQNQDDQIVLPISTLLRKLQSGRNATGAQALSEIDIKAVDDKSVDAAIAQVTAIMSEQHEGAQDFSVINSQDQVDAQKQSRQTLTILLAAVAGISLVVGGIGIMNIMIVSVTERTREIGIRKAVGARRQDILLQFLMEAVVVSLLGGLLGIAAGYAVSEFVDGRNLNGQVLQTVVQPDSIALAFGISVAIGLFFGIYPASRAARLNPIQALRYE
ncbi:MAG: ABC transporter permease [Dehalococcoidia bacterium]